MAAELHSEFNPSELPETQVPRQRPYITEVRMTRAEQAMLGSFYDYCALHDIDLGTDDPSQQPAISAGAHDFIAKAVEARVAQDRTKPESQQKYKFSLPRTRIDRALSHFYQMYPPAQMGDKVVNDFRQEDIRTNTLAAQNYRSQNPEIPLAEKLSHLLRTERRTLAAESVDILVAAYGKSFEQMAHVGRGALGRGEGRTPVQRKFEPLDY